MKKIEVFYKLVVADVINDYVSKQKNILHQELREYADDPVILKRRFRMLGQLGQYESQIYKKLYEFQTDDVDDYIQAAQLILSEIHDVVQRSG